MTSAIIKLGRTPYWFDGERFTVGNRPGAPGLDFDERKDLIRHLCGKARHLARWQGEENDAGNVVSVYDHSLLVAFLAYEIARKRLGEDSPDLRRCLIGGLVHDLGETLGLGDIAAPFLRKWPELRDLTDAHQSVINQMMRVDSYKCVKDADHLAAAIERRVFFGDFTLDCEAPGMDDLAAEVFGERSSYVLPGARGDGYESACMANIIDADSEEELVRGVPLHRHLWGTEAMMAMLLGKDSWIEFMIYSESGLIALTVTADVIARRVVE